VRLEHQRYGSHAWHLSEKEFGWHRYDPHDEHKESFHCHADEFER
jgi:hypothetical protein